MSFSLRVLRGVFGYAGVAAEVLAVNELTWHSVLMEITLHQVNPRSTDREGRWDLLVFDAHPCGCGTSEPCKSQPEKFFVSFSITSQPAHDHPQGLKN